MIDFLARRKKMLMEQHNDEQSVEYNVNPREPSRSSLQFGKQERDDCSNTICGDDVDVNNHTVRTARQPEIYDEDRERNEAQPSRSPLAMPATLIGAHR